MREYAEYLKSPSSYKTPPISKKFPDSRTSAGRKLKDAPLGASIEASIQKRTKSMTGDPADEKEALMREYAKYVLGNPFGALDQSRIVNIRISESNSIKVER